MRRPEALAHFQEHCVNTCILEKIHALDQYFRTNKENLAADFCENFRQFCRKIKEEQQQGKGPIAFMNLSLLRTALCTGSHTCQWEAYDAYWYLDPTPCLHTYDAGWVFSYLDTLASELERERRTYIILLAPDAEQAAMREARFYQYVVNLARFAVSQAVDSAEYREIKKAPVLHILTGEYQDICEIIHTEEQNEKDSAKIKKWLEKRQKPTYRYETLKNLDLKELSAKGLDLCYTRFDRSNLKQSRLTDCILLGCGFSGSDLQRAELCRSLIYDADFSYSNLSNADLSQSKGADGIGKNKTASFFGVNFKGANLTKTNFTQADLQGANFQQAIVRQTNFQQAKLDGAHFDQKEQNNPNLSDQQKQNICWINS